MWFICALFFRLLCSLFHFARGACSRRGQLPPFPDLSAQCARCGVRAVSPMHPGLIASLSIPLVMLMLDDKLTIYPSRSSLAPSSSRSNPLAQPTQRRSLHHRSAPRAARAAPRPRPPPPTRLRRAGVSVRVRDAGCSLGLLLAAVVGVLA